MCMVITVSIKDLQAITRRKRSILAVMYLKCDQRAINIYQISRKHTADTVQFV